MKMKNTVKIVMSVLFAASLSTQAAVLASWENDDVVAGGLSATADVTNPNISTTAQTTTFASAGIHSEVLQVLHNNGAVNSLAAAVTQDDYFTFSINPTGGLFASYDNIFARVQGQFNTIPGTMTFSLLSDATGLTAADVIDSFTLSNGGGTGLNAGTGTFDTSGEAALQEVAGVVEFRIYAHVSSGTVAARIGIGQGFGGADNDLIVNGTLAAATPAPEPTTFSLLIVGLGGLAFKRRSSNKNIS